MNIQSLKDKFKNIARENGRIYQEVLTVYDPCPNFCVNDRDSNSSLKSVFDESIG